MQRISSKLVGRIAIAVLAVAAGAACLGWRAHAADNRYVPRDRLPWEEDRLISIEMPDYLNKTRDEAFEQLNEAWRTIDRAARRSIDIVADERVPLEQRDVWHAQEALRMGVVEPRTMLRFNAPARLGLGHALRRLRACHMPRTPNDR